MSPIIAETVGHIGKSERVENPRCASHRPMRRNRSQGAENPRSFLRSGHRVAVGIAVLCLVVGASIALSMTGFTPGLVALILLVRDVQKHCDLSV